MKKLYLTLLIALCFSSFAFSQNETITITTYYPAPYGVYKNLQVNNPDESATLIDFTQGLTRAGFNIVTEYTAGTFTPGIFWSTSNDNNARSKAGIWLRQDANNIDMYFGTSNAFATGITNNGLVLDQAGNVGIGTTTPQGALDVVSTTGGFIVPRMTTGERTAPTFTAVNGMIVYDTTANEFYFRVNGAWKTRTTP